MVRNGWSIGTVQKEVVPGVMVEVDSKFNHPTLGEAASIDEACRILNAHRRSLRSEEHVTEYLRSNSWTLTDRGQWFRPNWDFDFDQRQREQWDSELEPGCYATLRQAAKIQAKLDSLDLEPSEELSSALNRLEVQDDQDTSV